MEVSLYLQSLCSYGVLPKYKKDEAKKLLPTCFLMSQSCGNPRPLGRRQNLEFISFSIVLVLEGGDAVGSFCWKVPGVGGALPTLGHSLWEEPQMLS